MNTFPDATLRSQLISRRDRLQTFMREERHTAQLIQLLKDVETALERLESGTYGICEICDEPIEDRYLSAEPLARVCLSHLSEEEQRSVERDLELAAKIQGRLLPLHDAPLDGWEIGYRYEPLGPLSGDYCDLVKPANDGGETYIVFGDVSGKGIAASLLMTHLHAMFRTLLETETPLKQLVQRANRLFSESTSSSHFATLVCVKLHPSGEVEICNAGHCFPLVVQDGQIRSIESTGLPIGMFFNGEYETRTVHLSRGDTLFLYTDGLTESRNPSGDEYSEARLSALVAREHHQAPKELVNTTIEDLSRFRSNSPRKDDLTVMVLRRTL
jgi:phosphoserine phosphatase RsbU/P